MYLKMEILEIVIVKKLYYKSIHIYFLAFEKLKAITVMLIKPHQDAIRVFWHDFLFLKLLLKTVPTFSFYSEGYLEKRKFMIFAICIVLSFTFSLIKYLGF